jgi:hypothetical protein
MARVLACWGLLLLTTCARPSTTTAAAGDSPTSPPPSAPAALPDERDSGAQTANAAVADVLPSDDAAPATREYTVEKWKVKLVDDGASCKLDYRVDGGEARRLALDVVPPCYLLLWHGSIPRVANAERAPVGGEGDPMAFRYRGKGDTLAIAVIGDAVPEMLRSGDRFRSAERQGYHCAGSAQGVLFRNDGVRTVPKRNQVGVFCVEIPIDEASFWLTAHEAKK